MKSGLNALVKQSVSSKNSKFLIALVWLQAAAQTTLFIGVGMALDAKTGSQPKIAPELTIVVSVIILLVATLIAPRFVAKVEASAEKKLQHHLLTSVFDSQKPTTLQPGKILALFATSAVKASHYRAAFLSPMVGAMTSPLLVLIIFAVLVDPVIAGILTLMLISVPLVIGVAQRAVSVVGTEHRTEQARLTVAFMQAVRGLSTLTAYGAAAQRGQKLAHRGQAYRKTLMRVLGANQILIFVIDIAVSLAVILMAAFLAAIRIESHSLSIGQAVSTLFVALLLIAPVDLVGQFFYIGIGGRASERAISAQLESPTRERKLAKPEAGGPDKSVIAFENVTAGWIEGHEVLKDISFNVVRGEIVALVGPSGVGKSTVSALIQGQLAPMEGRVLINGRATDDVDRDWIADQLSVVEQRSFLFNESIADNLRIASPDANEGNLWAALNQAGLEDEVRSMREGLQTVVGEGGLKLSGGQSQRLAIARAILRDKELLILDEATSQVDLAGESDFLETLKRISRSRTVLLIAHRPNAILAADRVVVLERAGIKA